MQRFLDYECGGHSPGSNEEAVAVFSEAPDITEEDLLRDVARRLYRNASARTDAINGWKSFDQGFGKLPIGLGDTNAAQFSGRFGFAWPMCLATPLVATVFGHRDRGHEIFWFSPYNFFTAENSPRLQVHFRRVLNHWEQALDQLAKADDLEKSECSRRELVAVQAHILGANSALNWCSAAALAAESQFPRGSWQVLLAEELSLIHEFQNLRGHYPWIWANNCWHPLETPLHQKGVGFSDADDDPFAAKIRILENEVKLT